MEALTRFAHLHPQEWDKIWTLNKKIIDPVCPRHTAVDVAGRVPVTLTNGPSTPEYVTVPRHPKNPAAGNKVQMRSASLLLDQADAVLLGEGEEVTLMAWGNAIIKVRELFPLLLLQWL